MRETINSRSQTPWGHSDTATQYAPGIVFYETPNHGGFHLSHQRRAEMPKLLRQFRGYSGDPQWYEEDCDWAVVALAFPSMFDGKELWHATNTVNGFSDGYGISVKDWLSGPEGCGVRTAAANWAKDNAKKFIDAGGHTDDLGWLRMGRTVDGTERAAWLFPVYPTHLPSLFSREEAEAAGGKELKGELQPA